MLSARSRYIQRTLVQRKPKHSGPQNASRSFLTCQNHPTNVKNLSKAPLNPKIQVRTASNEVFPPGATNIKLMGDVVLHGPLKPEANPKAALVMNRKAMALAAELTQKFGPRLKTFLNDRLVTLQKIRERATNGQDIYDFDPDTSYIRHDNSWKVAPVPEIYKRRDIELTVPADNASMLINALNSKANFVMPDIEDASSPSGQNVLDSHYNLYLATRCQLVAQKAQADGSIKRYRLKEKPVPFMARVRGLHLEEVHATIDRYGRVPATFFDIAVHAVNNGHELANSEQGFAIYVPKLHNGKEAKLIEKVLGYVEVALGLKHGSIKVTTLIETFPALFQTEEIAYSLQHRLIGQNAGRWDMLASRNYYLPGDIDPKYLQGDRSKNKMSEPHMSAYVKQIVKTANRRGFVPLGGMSAFIPDASNANAIEKVREDKQLEVGQLGARAGWVAHPGMVDPVGEVIHKCLEMQDADASYMTRTRSVEIVAQDLIHVPKANATPEGRTEAGLRENIFIPLQYLYGYFGGSEGRANGAVALRNAAGDLLMEDLATAQMGIHNVSKLLFAKEIEITMQDGKQETLTFELFSSIFDEEFQKLLHLPKVNVDRMNIAKKVYLRAIKECPEFISSITSEYLNPDYAKGVVVGDSIVVAPPKNLTRVSTWDSSWNSIKYDQQTLDSLQGTRKQLEGAELTKYRGDYKNRLLRAGKAFLFLGTATGTAATNVVSGGAIPYVGGWQENAMGLDYPKPDTLWVTPQDPAKRARIINNFLDAQDKVQAGVVIDRLEAIDKMPEETRAKELRKLQDEVNKYTNFHAVPILADLEQGWSDPKYIRESVALSAKNGIVFCHIEDQGWDKRCGHLWGKSIRPYNAGGKAILEAANYGAQEVLGSEQAEKRWIDFVARTDAYSAQRIVASPLLSNPQEIEHKYVDWERGVTLDGMHYNLKQGVNPETGNRYGLDLAIDHSVLAVWDGLARFIWMETPDADLRVAKAFSEGVNNRLEQMSAKAGLKMPIKSLFLYNFSPSFNWALNYYPAASVLADKIATYVNNHINMSLAINEITLEEAKQKLRVYIRQVGDDLKGDNDFSDPNFDRLFAHALDYARGEDRWTHRQTLAFDAIKNLEQSDIKFRLEREVRRVKGSAYNPKHHMTHIIVGNWIAHYSGKLFDLGYVLQLITLPEFHYDAKEAYKLAEGVSARGIEHFVQYVQRDEAKLGANYTHFRHQQATNTGGEAMFYSNLTGGKQESDILKGSTEKFFDSNTKEKPSDT